MKRHLVPGLTLALALVGAACSSTASVDVSSQAAATSAAVGDVVESARATAEAAEQAGSAALEDAADAADDAADAVAEAAEDAADGSSGSGSGSSGAEAAAEAILGGDWCESAAAIEENFDELDVVDFTDPVALEETYREFGDVIQATVAIAPLEIAPDVAQVAAGFAALSAELEAVDWDFLLLDLAVLDELAPELDIASFNIEKYNFEVCGIDNGFDPDNDPRLNAGASDEDIPLTGTVRDQAIAGLVAAGFTEEEATCIFSNVDLTDPAAMADSAGLLEVFEECGIPLERLGQLGG